VLLVSILRGYDIVSAPVMHQAVGDVFFSLFFVYVRLNIGCVTSFNTKGVRHCLCSCNALSCWGCMLYSLCFCNTLLG